MESDCFWCGTKYYNTSHLFWECEYIKRFWDDYYQLAKKAYNDREDFDRTVRFPRKLEPCFRANTDTVMLRDHRAYCTVLAKSSLLVCQRVGVLPLHSEHWAQMIAPRNLRRSDFTSDFHGFHMRWLKCPLPPPRGWCLLSKMLMTQKVLLLKLFVTRSSSEDWKLCQPQLRSCLADLL